MSDHAGELIAGVGAAATIDHRPATLVGSILSKGERIVSVIRDRAGFSALGGKRSKTLFDPDDVPPPELGPRFAVQGSTTRYGGALKEATADYREESRHIARISDYASPSINMASPSGARLRQTV